MNLFVASLPIVGSTLAILVFRQSALRAGMLGLLVTIVIIALWPEFLLAAQGFGNALASGLYNTMNVSYVLLGGVVLYQVLKAGSALDTIAKVVASTITSPLHSLLAIVFGVSVFFESATGFGVGIVVVAPLFLALGYTPLQAAVLALLGQCAVPWGALAVGTVLGSDLSGVSEVRLAELSAIISYPYLLLCGGSALLVSGLWSGQIRQLLWVVAYATLLSLALWLASVTIGIELAGCVAGLLVVTMAILINFKQRKATPLIELGRAVLPFVILMTGLFITRLFSSFGNALKEISIPMGEFTLELFYHPGFWLLVGAASGFTSLPATRGYARSIFRQSAKQWLLASLAVGGFLVFGELMKEAGMTRLIAQTIATAAGPYYAVAVPFIGGLGGFLTASNAASNALFMTLHIDAAEQLGLPVDVTAAAQNAAGSNSSMASPGRLVFAAAVAGTPGAESDLLQRILPVAILGIVTLTAMSLLLM